MFAVWQLRLTKQIHQKQFEDGLAKEYRELASRIPTKALLGSGLSPDAFERSFDELFRYVDLSNEQVSLRVQGRVSDATWSGWSAGIRFNLALPAFRKAWKKIRATNPHQFLELQRAADENFSFDPRQWTSEVKR